jgi:hypothetical protein
MGLSLQMVACGLLMFLVCLVFDNFHSSFHIEATDDRSKVFFDTKMLFFSLNVFSS